MELLLEFDEQQYYGESESRLRRSSGTWGSSSTRDDEDLERIMSLAAVDGDVDALDELKARTEAANEDELAVIVIKLLERIGGEAAVLGAHEDGMEDSEGDAGRDEDEDGRHGPVLRCDARYVALGVELLGVMPETKFGPSHRGALGRGIRHVLNSYMGNCRAVCDVGVLKTLLHVLDGMLRSNEDVEISGDALLIAECLRRVAGYSTSTLDLKAWLRLASSSAPNAQVFLLDQLNMTLQSRYSSGPAEIFLLDGESSGILGSAQPKWPFTEGLAFVTWMYLESVSASETTTASAASYAAAASVSQQQGASTIAAAAVAAAAAGDSEVHMPRIFSFLSAEGQGVECYFHDRFLIMETNGSKESRMTLPFSYKFPLKRWFCMGIEHKPASVRTGAAETRLYVNGICVETHSFDFPKMSKPLGFCCVGTNPPAAMAGLQRKRRQCALFASLGPVYIFKQALGGHAMKALSDRGGSHVPRFGDGTSTSASTSSGIDQVLDNLLAPTVLQILHPRLASKSFVLDISPAGAKGESKAALLGGTKFAKRSLMRDSIWSSGSSGPAIVLPFVCPFIGSRDLDPGFSDVNEETVSAGNSIRSVIGIIAGACENHPENLAILEESNVASLLSHVLPYGLDAMRHQFSGDALDDEEEAVLDSLEHLISVVQGHKVLMKQVYTEIILDLRPWDGLGARGIRRLLNMCSAACNSSPQVMHQVGAFQSLLDNARRWLCPTSSMMGGILHNNSTKSVMDDKGKFRVSEVESLALIDDLLVSVNLLANTCDSMEVIVDIIVGYLAECPCPHMLAATVKLVHSMIVSPKSERANEFLFAFVARGGVEICLGLIRALSLRGKFDHKLQGVQTLFGVSISLFGYMLETGCISANRTTEVGGSKKVTKGSVERAVRYAFNRGSKDLLTLDVYKAVMQSALSIDITTNINMTEPVRMISAGILGSMLATLSRCGDEVSKQALNDMMLIAIAYAENRDLLLSLPEFPNWLTGVLVKSQSREVLDAASNLLLILLQHSMRISDGWRVLENVITSIESITSGDKPKRIEVQHLIFRDLTNFMLSELKAICVSEDVKNMKSSSDRNVTYENTIALLHMAEEHLRCLATSSVASNTEDEVGQVFGALVSYGNYSMDTIHGWKNRRRLIDGLTVQTPSITSKSDDRVVELLVATQQIITSLVGSTCANADSYPAILKDDELVHLLLRLTLANFREEKQSVDEIIDDELPLMPAHIVNTLGSLTSGNSSISDAIAFESKSLWGTSQSSVLGKKLSVLHNLLTPLLQAASVRQSAHLAPGVIALLLDEVWRHNVMKRRNSVYIRALTTYLIAMAARWRDAIAENPEEQISSNTLRSLASSTMDTAISKLCTGSWVKLLTTPVIEESLMCIATSTPVCEVRNSVMVARGPISKESRLQAQLAVQRTRTDTFAQFVQTWEGEYVHITMSSKWLAALSKEVSRRTLCIATEGSRLNATDAAWKLYARDLKAHDSLMGKIRDESDAIRLGVDSLESGRRRRYRLSRVTKSRRVSTETRLAHAKPLDATAMEIKLPVRHTQDISDDEDDLPLSPQKSMNAEEMKEVMAATAALAVAANRSGSKSTLHECSATMVTPLEIHSGNFGISEEEITFSTADGSHTWTWPLASLHQVQSRRYLLRRSALEFFMLDRSTHFIDFGTASERRQVFRVLIKIKPKNFVPLYLETSKPEALLRKSDITSRWIRREISNFDYLMALNTLAGRTYQDITQYPVFPWVISDYTSDVLDLNDPKVYRDLRKPVGALNPARLERIKERYDFFDDPEIPKFHYGSHYSSSGTVLFYLLRVDPFTTLAYELQGGKFDHADRLFHSVASTWRSCYSDMSDVKELVPEFFYMPEMFKNVNNINFGVTQNDEKVDGVILPPWADSPEDFVAKQRAALESEFVSKNLHHWIDLIFGYKQKGKAAESACNVFYYMTYEGAVDVEAIQDPLLLKATEDQIACFGQTPSQLLTIPHPARQRMADSVTGSHLLFDNGENVREYKLATPSYAENRTSFMGMTSTGQIVVASPALDIKIHHFLPNVPGNSGMPFTFEPAKEQTTLGSFMGSIRRRAGFSEAPECVKAMGKLDPRLAREGSPLPCAILPGGRHLVIAGYADNSLQIFNMEKGVVESVKVGHRGPILTLAASTDGRVLATGSADGTIGIWTVKLPTEKVTIGENLRETIAPIIRVDANSIFNDGTTVANVIDVGQDDVTPALKMSLSGPVGVLKGHGDAVAAIALSTNLDLLVAVSPFGGTSFYSIMTRDVIAHVPKLSGSLCSVSDEGFVAVWSEQSHTMTVLSLNGNVVSTAALQDVCPALSTMLISKDGYSLVAGTTAQAGKSSVVVFDLPQLRLRKKWDFEAESSVSSVLLTPENTNMIVCTTDGTLRVFVDPSLSARSIESIMQAGWSSVI